MSSEAPSSQHPESFGRPCWHETPQTAFHSELGKALTRVNDTKNIICRMGRNSEAPWRTLSLSTCCKVHLPQASGKSHLSAAFSLARAKSHQCDPVGISGASQRVSPACSASLQHLNLHAENMKIFFFSISLLHSCPFFIPPIPYS